MLRGCEIRLYPNKKQETQIQLNIDASRFVYNYFLAEKKRAWKEEQKSLSRYDMSKMLTTLKQEEEYVWLKSADSCCLVYSLIDLDKAYQNFFAHRAKYPKFHSRYKGNQSYTTQNNPTSKQAKKHIRIEGNKITFLKLGAVKARGLERIDGVIKSATIIKKPSGKYFASVLVETEDVIKHNGGEELGIDVGIKEFYTDSNGNVVDNPRVYQKAQRKLRREQRRLSRKQKGSNNYNKQKIKVARVHEKVANIRKDFIDKQTIKIAEENRFVAVENLNIKGMVKNRRLAKQISDVSWGTFFTKLNYKMEEHGGLMVKVDTYYPSSQTCSCCGYKNPIVKNLSIREWDCPECGSHHNRDENAARNILNKAKENLVQ